VLAIVPVWSVVNATAGSINSGTGLFTAGSVNGIYNNTVKATSGAVSGFATVIVAAPALPLVDFGTAAINGIMAGLSVTCTGSGVIQATSGTANISISPGSTINGFPPCIYSGTEHLGDAQALTDQTILTAAYNTLAGQPCPAANNFGTADYAGKTLPAGVYCSGSTMNVTGTLTLDGGGDPNATFVFQAGSALIGAANIVLINSAKPQNVYWQVGSSATLNASAWQGNIVALTSISLNVNSTLLGRAMARNGSVTMDASHNVITLP
jgi:Ice-binding-like